MVSIYNLHMLIWITIIYGVITHGSRLKRTTSVPDSMSSQIYPDFMYNVYKGSMDFARIADPLSDLKLQKFNFQLEEIENSEIFGITKKGGIVYVKDAKLLKKFNQTQFTLKIIYGSKITVGTYGKTEIILKIDDSPDEQCNFTSHCSDIHLDTKSKCISSCGIGSISKCQWRESPKPDMFTANYSTCTPDINTCPDEKCDQLEIISHLICPQDCTREVFGTGKEGKNGIAGAKGVCTCDEIGKCTCETKVRGGQLKNQKNKTDYIATTSILPADQDACKIWCINNVNTSIITVILFVTIGIVYYCRNRIVWSFGHHKTNRNVRTFEELLPNRVRDGYQTNPRTYGNTFTVNADFDPKWEFPRSRLVLKEIIGEGEFGKVLKAQATDIPGTKGVSTVAVKTTKNNAGRTEKDDLLSEYNLLKDVKHPNVVRLLGACTTPDGPFYLIIEYAKHGSLRSYLRKSRILDTSSITNVPDARDFRQGERVEVLSFPLYPISPLDVLKFAWQISKGMAYLTELKLVHRDLAARNVLVTEDKVCKISDFGLTRDVYEDNAYFKRTKGRVPVKWMAPESLADQIYTSRSDIWSFGILLWELVTLGAVPYPGIAVQDLFKLLKEGYRMDKPNNCSNELYDVMRSCWAEDQYRRPSFKSLTASLEEMLEKGNDYLQLDYKKIANNMCYFMDDEEQEIQNRTINESIEGEEKKEGEEEKEEKEEEEEEKEVEVKEEEVRYKVPKPLNEIGMSYVTMRDFIFDPEQQTQVV